MVQIGKITSTHGIKGEVKIYSMSDFNRFFIGTTIHVLQNEHMMPLVIKTSRMHKNMHLISFEGLADINLILPYVGRFVYAKAQKAETLEKDDYHYQDLIGKKAYLDDGTYIGVVTSMIEVPQGHLMEIEKEDQKKVLIPFVKAFIGDINQKHIIIHPIEGLL